MIIFTFPDGAENYDAAAFTQSGAWILSGHREEAEQAAIDAGGLYCIWSNGRPIIRANFEGEL